MVDFRVIVKSGRPQLISHLLIAWLLCMPAAVCFAQDKVEISFDDGLVSVQSDNADLKQVLQRLSTESGFRLWISDNLQQQQVSVRIEKQTMEEALRQLLVDNSYALVYDNNDVVTALHVLPPGTTQPANVMLTPETDDARQQVMQDALESSLLPDNVKSALLNQFAVSDEAVKNPVTVQRSQVLEALIENLKNLGAANPETMDQLRLKLELENTLKTE